MPSITLPATPIHLISQSNIRQRPPRADPIERLLFRRPMLRLQVFAVHRGRSYSPPPSLPPYLSCPPSPPPKKEITENFISLFRHCRGLGRLSFSSLSFFSISFLRVLPLSLPPLSYFPLYPLGSGDRSPSPPPPQKTSLPPPPHGLARRPDL